MIYTKTLQVPISIAIQQTPDDHLELNRLLAAAVVNTQFCQLLLDDPGLALQNGYQGETFFLSEEERALILSIRADTLTDLARELVRTFGERLHPCLTHSAPALEFVEF
jgi:hypothetical protein